MISIETIQQRLADEISNSELTQTQIAKLVGVNQAQISRYLSHKKLPSVETLANLCKVLNIDANYILGISD